MVADLQLDAIFWDFDGTLVYSHSLWTNSVLTVLRRLDPKSPVTFDALRPHLRSGYPWDVPDPQYRPLQGRAWWAHVEQLFIKAYAAVGVPEQLARRAAPLVREEILKVEHYHLFPDTLAALEQCKSLGCRNILLSNNYPELEDIMGQLGLLEYFDGLVISGQIGWDKPRPQIFEHAKALAGPGARCLMVGDNPLADVQGAQGVGLPAALVHRQAPSTAEYIADTLAQLLEQLGMNR